MMNRIYLQVRDEDGETPDEITWCVDRIHDTDVEYVPAAELRHAQAERDTLSALIDLYRAVDDLLYHSASNGYPDDHHSPNHLAALRAVFLEMSVEEEAGNDEL